MTNLDGIIKKINQIFTDSANESQSTCDNSVSLKEIVNVDDIIIKDNDASNPLNAPI